VQDDDVSVNVLLMEIANLVVMEQNVKMFKGHKILFKAPPLMFTYI